jgi:hypothetical protein
MLDEGGNRDVAEGGQALVGEGPFRPFSEVLRAAVPLEHVVDARPSRFGHPPEENVARSHHVDGAAGKSRLLEGQGYG